MKNERKILNVIREMFGNDDVVRFDAGGAGRNSIRFSVGSSGHDVLELAALINPENETRFEQIAEKLFGLGYICATGIRPMIQFSAEGQTDLAGYKWMKDAGLTDRCNYFIAKESLRMTVVNA